jgi:hypothetical protein
LNVSYLEYPTARFPPIVSDQVQPSEIPAHAVNPPRPKLASQPRNAPRFGQ